MKIGLRFIALFLLLLPLAMQAQVLNVIGELREDFGNAYAVQNPVEDYNYNLCGVVFLGLIYEDVTFEGDIIKSEFSKGEWIIYMPQGSRWLNIKSNSNMFPPLHYDFPQVVQSKSVYVMTVVLRDGAAPVTQQYLAFKIEPTNAVLEVDGKLWSVDADGSAMKYVDFGSYVYTVRASDYFGETGRVTVNDPDNTKMVTVKLKPNFAKVTFKVDADAEIWVNNEKKGIRTWTGSLGSGTYKVECKKANYETSLTSVEITADKNGQIITLPAPRPVYGSLMVESTPNFCKLFIDGKEIGITPKSVNEIQVGQHEIRLTQEGYTDYKETVTITKNERKQVKATLEKPKPIVQESKPVAQEPTVQELKQPNVSATCGEDLTFIVDGVSFTMKQVEGGTFQMGITLNQRSVAKSNEKTNRVKGFFSFEKDIEEMARYSKMITYFVNPDPLVEGEDGNVCFDVIMTIPDEYFEKWAVLNLKPHIDYHGGQIDIDPITFVGEKVKGEGDFRVSYKDGGEFTKHYCIPYQEEMKNCELMADLMFYVYDGTIYPTQDEIVKNTYFTQGAIKKLADGVIPFHSVNVSSYYIGETEVTQALWKAVMGSNPSYFKGDNLPVERVSWNDIQEFILKLNQKTGKNFRLPTEAEWEYAARGGEKSNGYQYAGGNNIGSVAWYRDNSDSKTHPVKGKASNELGLYDMSGNVWEWCQDWYGRDYYGESPSTNPQGPSTGSCRVLRGGSWCHNARYCPVSYRDYGIPDTRSNAYGVRLCLPQ